jgi:hypothetical protein
MPIIRTLTNISIHWVFLLLQLTLESFESRINVAESEVVLLEELQSLNTWMKDFMVNCPLPEIFSSDQFFELTSSRFLNPAVVDVQQSIFPT